VSVCGNSRPRNHYLQQRGRVEFETGRFGEHLALALIPQAKPGFQEPGFQEPGFQESGIGTTSELVLSDSHPGTSIRLESQSKALA
jgi:hypothetical protein